MGLQDIDVQNEGAQLVKEETMTAFGRAFLQAVEWACDTREVPSRGSDLFRPRRMAYVFDLDDETTSTTPTTVLRSKHDVPGKANRMSCAEDAQIVERLADSLSFLKMKSAKAVLKIKRRKQKEREAEQLRQETQNSNQPNQSWKEARSEPGEEDIFADVGTDYEPVRDYARKHRKPALHAPGASYFGENQGGEAAQPAERTTAHDGKNDDEALGEAADEEEVEGEQAEAVEREQLLPPSAEEKKPNIPDNIFTRGADEPWKRKAGMKPSERLKAGLPIDDDYAECFPESTDFVGSTNDQDEPLTEEEKKKEMEKKKDEKDPNRKVKSQLAKLRSKFKKEYGDKYDEAFVHPKKAKEKEKSKQEGQSNTGPSSDAPAATPHRKKQRVSL